MFNIIANPTYLLCREADKAIFSGDLVWFGTLPGTAVVFAVRVRAFVEEPRLIILKKTSAQGLGILVAVSSRLLYVDIYLSTSSFYVLLP